MRKVEFGDILLEHFRCHESMAFNFSTNRFVTITGPNGIGKTTILDALCWALYDVTTKGRKGDSVIRKRTGKNTYVRLDFKIDEDFYIIKNYRKHHKHGDNKILYKNGETKDHDISGATRKDTNLIIEQLLMPKDIFLNCLCFSQYIDKSFTESSHGKQTDVIDVMLDVGKFDSYCEKAKEAIKEVRAEAEVFTSKLPVIESGLVSNKEMLHEEEATKKRLETEKETKKESLTTQIDSLKTDIKIIEDEIAKFAPLEAELQEANLEKARTETKVQELSDKDSAIIDELRVKYGQLFESESKTIEAEYAQEKSKIDSDIASAQNEIDKLNEKEQADLSKSCNKKNTAKMKVEEEYRERFETCASKTSTARQEVSKLTQQLENDNKEVSSLEQEIEEIKNTSNAEKPTCYTCGQEIGGESAEKIHSDLLEKEQRLSKLYEDVTLVEDSLITLQGDLDKLVQEDNTLRKEKNEKLADIDAEFIKIKSEIEFKYSQFKKTQHNIKSDFLSEYEKLQSGRDAKLAKKKEELKVKGAEESKKLREEVSSNLEKEKLKIGNLVVSIAKIEPKVSNLVTMRANLANKTGAKEHCEKELSTFDEQYETSISDSDTKIKNLKKNIKVLTADLSGIKDSLDVYGRKIHILEFWRKGFSDTGIKAILLDEAIPILNEKSRELSNMVDNIRVRFDSQTQLQSGDMRNKFAVNVIQTKNLTDDRGDFSGGEGRVVDIITLMSLRYLLERMQNITFNILLLDEVLDSLDETNVDMVLNMIRELSSQYCAVLLTHTWKDRIECDEHLPM